MKIVDYSEKAIAVIGDTKPYRETLKSLGGRFNPRLTCGCGWVFSKKRIESVKSFIESASFTPDKFDMQIEDAMAERCGVGNELSPYMRGNY